MLYSPYQIILPSQQLLCLCVKLFLRDVQYYAAFIRYFIIGQITKQSPFWENAQKMMERR